nr:uncharacterized protein LOC129387449 [Dermacentor andersoni]
MPRQAAIFLVALIKVILPEAYVMNAATTNRKEIRVERPMGCDASCVLSFGCWQYCDLLDMEGHCRWNECYCIPKTLTLCKFRDTLNSLLELPVEPEGVNFQPEDQFQPTEQTFQSLKAR